MTEIEIPKFPYHRNPKESQSLKFESAVCECCGQKREVFYDGLIYAVEEPDYICLFCISDGSAAEKYDGSFFDAYFIDDNGNQVEVADHLSEEVFSKTIGFATYNPIGWWVHCGEPAEYVRRIEPYELVFECRKCHKQHIVNDYD